MDEPVPREPGYELLEYMRKVAPASNWFLEGTDVVRAGRGFRGVVYRVPAGVYVVSVWWADTARVLVFYRSAVEGRLFDALVEAGMMQSPEQFAAKWAPKAVERLEKALVSARALVEVGCG